MLITSEGAHSSVKAMAKVMDADVLLVPVEDKMQGIILREAINALNEEDRNRIFAVVATAGTTNAGIIDDLKGIAAVCKEFNLWLHIDAAYRGRAMAADSVRHLFTGIEEADSITIDPHKWLFSPYDCGAVIYRNPELAKKAHARKVLTSKFLKTKVPMALIRAFIRSSLHAGCVDCLCGFLWPCTEPIGINRLLNVVLSWP